MPHESKHKPVLVEEVMTLLHPRAGAFIVDGTIDGGGHAEAILKAIGPKGKLV